MNPQSSTDEVDAENVMHLGERALAQLSLQVRVAQMEARKAELELLMGQAAHGDIAPLQQWLKVHGHYTSANSSSTPSERHAADGWDYYRPMAIARLRQRSESKSLASGSSQLVAEDVRVDTRHLPSAVQANGQDQGVALEQASPTEAENGFALLLDEPHSQPAIAEPEFATEFATELELPEEDKVESISPELLAELKLDTKPVSEEQSLAKRGRWRGVLISAVVHVVVVLVLAAVTLDTPMKDGLLSLVASDTSSSSEVDSFELTQESDVQEPVTDPVDTVTPASESNLSEALPGLSESLSNSLSQPTSSGNAGAQTTMMAAKAGDSKAMASFYGVQSSGNTFCFVVDGSGSMRGDPWEAARFELMTSISSLKPTQKFYLIFFNKEVLAITEPGKNQPARAALYATPENIAHAKRWLDTLQIMTGDPPMKAMEAALQIECDCIYFLADGEMSETIAKKLLDSLRKNNRATDIIDGEVVLIPIHTIAYYSEKGQGIMRQIAAENRGQFKYVPKPPKPKTSRGK